MVLVGKIFRITENMKLPDIAYKLKNFRKEEPYNIDSSHFNLITEIHSLTLMKNQIQGVFAQDIITYIYHHGERIPTPTTIETTFAFVEQKERLFLVVMERKFLANNIANKLSEIIFITTGYITEASIQPEILKIFHEQNPENTKIIFFNDIDIPNINKLSLYGSGLINSTLYNDYCNHGKIWYIVITSKKQGNIVGITRDAVVTVFNRIDKTDFLSYVIDEISPLIK